MSGVDTLTANGLDPSEAEKLVDADNMPLERAELCVNCGQRWGAHTGWRCPNRSDKLSELCSKLPHTHRYLTQDMMPQHPVRRRATIQIKDITPAAPASTELPSDWKVWRDVNRNHLHCPCGIFSEDCQYHRSST
jgi:hypothetical protein